jgi:hypothetical protein
MYAARGLRVVRIRGDFEFNGIKGLVALLPTATILDLSAENEHIGAIERNIRYCKRKSGPSEWAYVMKESLGS